MSDDVPNPKRGLRAPWPKGKGAGVPYGSKGDSFHPMGAQGAGHVAEKAPLFEPGNKAAAGPHDMSKSERVKALQDHLFHLALNAAREETQATCAMGLHDRLVPKVTHTINTNTDPSTMTDAELVSYLRGDPEPKATH